MTPARLSPDAGFTLIEMIVSLALLAMLMALVPSTLQLARRGPAIGAQLDRHAATEAALAFIAQRLAEATPIFQRGDDGRLQVIFSGTPESVGFVAPVRFAGGENGLGRFDIRLGSGDTDERGVVLSWHTMRTAAQDLASGEHGPDTSAAEKSRVLIRAASSLRLQYYGSLEEGGAPEWAGSWTRTDSLPEMVELTVSTPEGERLLRVAARLRLP